MENTGLPRKIKDKTGNRYGKIIVLSFKHIDKSKSKTGRTVWECKCDCGKIFLTSAWSLQTKRKLVVVVPTDQYLNWTLGYRIQIDCL